MEMEAAGDLQGAIQAFESALRLSPQDKDLLNMAGLAYYRAGHFESAFSAIQRCVTA